MCTFNPNSNACTLLETSEVITRNKFTLSCVGRECLSCCSPAVVTKADVSAHSKVRANTHRPDLISSNPWPTLLTTIPSLSLQSSTMDALKDYLAAVPPAQYCQLFFILSTSLVLLLCVLPDAARRTLLDYGARSPKTATKDVKADVKPAPATGLEGFVVGLTSYGQVPHSWFLHFYVLSVAWSAFWAWQFLSKGSAMGALARWQTTSADGSVDPGRVFVSWCLMALQGSRRLYESLYVSKPGSSPMWFVHWALGLVYYTAMGMSIWIEGSGMCDRYTMLAQ